MDHRLLGLFIVFAPLSLLSFGGGQSIIADMQHQTVNVHGFLSPQEFADLFAVSRAAPGPTTLIAALLGFHVAGFTGALVSCIAIYLPSSLLVYGFATWWQKYKDSPMKKAVERGLAPVAVGLIFAGALAIVRSANIGPLEIATLVTTCALFYFTKVGSYTVIASVAALFFAVHVLF